MDAGPIADENPIDLILILDTSGSMKYGLDGKENPKAGESRWDYLKEALVGNTQKNTEGILPDFYEFNPKNQVRFISFKSSAKDITTPYKTPESVSTYLNSLSIGGNDGGTNYDGAIQKLKSALETPARGYSTYVVFLSDGEPTFYGTNTEGGGTFTNAKCAEHTRDAIKDLYDTVQTPFTLSTIAFCTDADNPFLKKGGGTADFGVDSKYDWNKTTVTIPSLPSENGFGASSSNLNDLREQLYLMAIGPRCKSLVLTDTLSENVDFDFSNLQLVVKAIPNGTNLDGSKKQSVTIYQVSTLENSGTQNGLLANEIKDFSLPNGNKTGTEEDKKPWTPLDLFGSNGGVYLKNKQISLVFNPSWEMDATYRYEISFNISTTQTAYENYANQGGYGNVAGSDKSDYLNLETANNTSSNKPGFYANDAATLKYIYDGKYIEETQTLNTDPTGDEIRINPYQKPVIQTEASQLLLVKEDGYNPEKRLPGAVFELYRASDTADAINPWNVKGTLIRTETTGEKGEMLGKIDFNKLTNNTVYYIKESDPPGGYIRLNHLIKIEFNGKDTTYTLLDLSGNTVSASNDVSVITEGRYITVKVKNTAGKPLPNTGGSGTQLYTFSGLSLLASCFMYGYISRRNKWKEANRG